MIIDSHVHVLPDTVRESLSATRDTDPWFATCHPEGAAIASAESLIEAMDADGVDKSVCFTWPFADMRLCREANDDLAAAVRRYPDRLIGFGIVNPAAVHAGDEVRRCASMGLVGIGELNADAQDWTFEGEAISTLMQVIAECELKVNVHVSEALGHEFPGRGTAWPSKLITWADRFPNVNTIAAHLGGGLPFFSELPGAIAACEQLWFDTATLPFLYKPSALRQAFDLLPVDRVIYGSDFPLLRLARYRDQFGDAGLDELEMEALMGGNAAALFGEA